MIYHIVTGDLAAAPVREAVASEESMAGEVVVIKDVLSVGQLQKEEGQKFSDLRSHFWQEVVMNEKAPAEVDDMERLLEVSLALAKNGNAQAWVWMAPLPADVCTYHWLLPYLGRYTGQLFIVNIAGLPFLDENGKLFFPKSIAGILPREVVKARRLARLITGGELETDTEEWQKLIAANAGIRTLEGAKTLRSRRADHYDNLLINFTTHQYQKASRVIAQALGKHDIPTGDLYLGWRLRQMAAAGRLELQGDVTKTLKDYDVKLPGDGSDAQGTLSL